MKLKRIVSTVLATVLAMSALSLTGCGSSATDASSEGTTGESAASDTASTDSGIIADIKKSGQLVLGTASGYPPYEFVSTADNNQIVGIDIELGKAIAEKLGVELKVTDMAFGELISALVTKKCDIAIAGMPETPERAKAIDFSDVYVNDAQTIFIRKEDTDKFKTLADFDGLSIGVEKGSSCEEVANKEMTKSTIVSLAKVPDLFLELKNGKIDGIILPSVVGKQYVISDETLGQVADTVQFTDKDKPCQAAVNKGNEEFLKLVNDVIAENQQNGNFDKWIDKYSKLANEQAGN